MCDEIWIKKCGDYYWKEPDRKLVGNCGNFRKFGNLKFAEICKKFKKLQEWRNPQ